MTRALRAELPAELPAELVDRVRERLAAGDTDVATALRAESGGIVDDTVFDRLRRGLHADLHGAGPLEALLALDGVTDVLVNGPESVWIDRGRGMEPTSVRFADDAAVRTLAQRLAASTGRRLDDAMPFVDAVLADGTRLHAVLPPIAEATTISLRVLGRRHYDLGALEAFGLCDAGVARLFRQLVAARLAVVIAGGTGTGKTTLLGALLGQADPAERIVLVEDAPELTVAHPHVVRLLARPANVDGAGAVELRDLVRQALRMRPDRLVVGEFRGAETVDLLVALNTGHEGGAATLHANSARDVPARFGALGALAGLPLPAMTSLVASAVDVVVQLRRDRAGRRTVREIALLEREGDGLVVVPAWTARAGAAAGAAPLAALIDERSRG